jgi:nitrogen fixation/metabolism regulation signal transduction histidine kinase
VQGISETVTPAIDSGVLVISHIVIFLIILIPGIIINFIFGAVAAYFVTRRWNDESITDIIERAKNSQKMNRKMPW